MFVSPSTHLRHLPRYPFTDISRAVSEFDSVGLSDDQEFHRVPIDEQNICEVDGHDATFFEQALKYVQVLGSDPTADPHDHPIVFSRESVNSQAHGSSFAPRLLIFLTSLRPLTDVQVRPREWTVLPYRPAMLQGQM
jgi:hypothetical protein